MGWENRHQVQAAHRPPGTIYSSHAQRTPGSQRERQRLYKPLGGGMAWGTSVGLKRHSTTTVRLFTKPGGMSAPHTNTKHVHLGNAGKAGAVVGRPVAPSENAQMVRMLKKENYGVGKYKRQLVGSARFPSNGNHQSATGRPRQHIRKRAGEVPNGVQRPWGRHGRAAHPLGGV